MAIVVHNSGSQTTTLVSGTQVTNCALRIHGVPQRFLVFNIAIRANTGSVTAGSVFWQPAGTATGQEALTFLGAINHATDALRIEQWGLLAPSASTATTSRVVFTTNLAVKAAYTATCYQGVHQTTPYIGYPSAATDFASGQGSTLTSPAGETTAISATSVSGDFVVDVFGSDMAATTNNFNTLGTNILTGRVSIGGAIGSNIRMGTSYTVATTTSTSMKWKSYTGSTTAFNTGQSGRTYVHGAFALKPSATVAPYWVFPPNEIVAVGATTAASTRYNSLSDWPTAGSLGLFQTIGPGELGTATNLLAKQFTSHTATIPTGASTYAGSVTMGDATIYKMYGGDGQSALGTGTVTVYIPGTAQADDIMLFNVYTEPASVTVSAVTLDPSGTPTTATEIANQTTAELRHTLLYKRLTSAEISASTVNVTFSATPTWRSVVATIYRGCITSGAPYVTAGAGAPTANTGSGASAVVTGLTTPGTDHTVVMAAVKFTNTTWTSPVGSGTPGEREEFFNQWIGEISMPTAGAVANQTITANNGASTWATMAITLIPSLVGTPHERALTQSGRVYSSDAISRIGTYTRTVSQTGRAYSSDTLSRVVKYIRALAQSGRAFSSGTVARAQGWVRTLAQNGRTWNSNSDDVNRLVGFNRTLDQNGRSFVSAVVSAIVGTISSTAWVYTLAQSGRAFSSGTVARIVTLTRTAAQSGRAYSSDAVARKQALKRTAAQSGRAYSSDAVARKVAYSRTLANAAPTGFTIVLTPVFTGAIISFYDFGSPNQPMYQKIDDWTTVYPGVSFYFEAQLSSNVNSASYAELYDVTAGATVAGSQVITTAPHTTSQVVRSVTPMNLVAGHVYKARIGHASGVISAPVACRIIVRDVS